MCPMYHSLAPFLIARDVWEGSYSCANPVNLSQRLTRLQTVIDHYTIHNRKAPYCVREEFRTRTQQLLRLTL